MNSISLPLTRGHAQPRRARFLRRIVREPLLHFALIGAAIFAGAHAVEDWRQRAQLTITVDADLRERLAGLYRTQFGVAPTVAQLAIVVDDYIDDEVLYREALRLGLAEDDEIVRRRLIQKLEFLQRDSVAGSDPSLAELRAYYDAHLQSFMADARVSFEQRFFSPDQGGEAQALERARAARLQLLAGETVDGDTVPLESGDIPVTREQAQRLLGTSAAAAALFSPAAEGWSEPVRSGFGWHLLKAISREPAHLLAFEQVLPDVRAAYLDAATSRARRARFDSLRARYHIRARETAG